MKKEFPELPGWSFEIEESTSGACLVAVTGDRGQRFEVQASDLESALIDAREEAAALAGKAQFEGA